MIRPSLLLRLCGAGLLALSLSACISLFPEAEPSQLYRFEGRPAAVPSAAGERTANVGVARSGGSFTRAAAGDRLLAITGTEASYIAESRWVAPAVTLFDEAVARAFDLNSGAARLVSRLEASRAEYSLRLDVVRFETVYDRGQRSAPVVHVSLRATLTRADRSLAGTQLFEAQVRAPHNRVSAIVEAYDQAVGQALGELVTWTNRTATPAG